MTTWPLRATLIALTFTVGCGAPPPADDTTKPAAAPATKKGSVSRADEIIADLKKREEEQAKIQKDAREAVPVVTEYSPASAPAKKTSSPGTTARPSSSTMGAPAGGPDANYLRQEVSIAQARLTSAEQKLQAAQSKMNAAQAQANDQNSAVRRIGQSAYAAAQQEYSQAQNEVRQAQYALDSARSRVR